MLIIPYDLIVIMKKVTFRYYVKNQSKVLIIALVIKTLILVKQIQNKFTLQWLWELLVFK